MKSTFTSCELEIIKEMLAHDGLNIKQYQDKFLKRRIKAAIRRSEAKSPKEYIKLLKTNPEERKKLEPFFSINVTRFFRNYETFELLEKHYLPQLIARKQKTSIGTYFLVKIWSVGCANGAEPYTLAILYFQILGDSLSSQVRITGTDVNIYQLEIAKKGLYPAVSMEEVPSSILKMLFTKQTPEFYQINPRIQKMVQFRVHNILEDPPLEQLDMILCRNVLIYFSRESQRKIYKELAKSLNPHGLLILGRTESLPVQHRLPFKVLDRRHKIYQKIQEWD